VADSSVFILHFHWLVVLFMFCC